MNKRLEKVREDIRKHKERKREIETRLRELLALQHQLEDEEIVAYIRSHTEKGGDVMETLRKVSEMKRELEKEHIVFDDDEVKEVDIDD